MLVSPAHEYCFRYSVVDQDTDQVGSASFCWIRIRIAIQGMPIGIRPIRLGINIRHMKKLINYLYFFHKISICCLKYLKL
jgi:hypothetical protein